MLDSEKVGDLTYRSLFDDDMQMVCIEVRSDNPPAGTPPQSICRVSWKMNMTPGWGHGFYEIRGDCTENSGNPCSHAMRVTQENWDDGLHRPIAWRDSPGPNGVSNGVGFAVPMGLIGRIGLATNQKIVLTPIGDANYPRIQECRRKMVYTATWEASQQFQETLDIGTFPTGASWTVLEAAALEARDELAQQEEDDPF